MQDDLRALPSVERLLQTEPLRSAAQEGPRTLAVEAARRELEQCRAAIVAGNGGLPALEEIAARAANAMHESGRPSLGPVINATGVVIHTNLGRAPLAFEALEAIDSAASGYSNLEYDAERGERGSRQAHVEPLVCELTGSAAAIAVNNNAAAVLLALAALASGREVVISRGQLVEIGGSFRIPEILAASGARLVEVGTTNRTRIEDYERAIGPDTAALMRVHASNFRTVGFTEEVDPAGARRAGAKSRADADRRPRLRRPRSPARRARERARRRARGARRASRPAPTSSASPATSCWAGRRPASPRAREPRSAACARTRWHGHCESTSSRWRRWRRRCGCTAIPHGRHATSRCCRCWRVPQAELEARAQRLRDGHRGGSTGRGAAAGIVPADGQGRWRRAAAARARRPGRSRSPRPRWPPGSCTPGSGPAIRRSWRGSATTPCSSTRARSRRSRSTSWCAGCWPRWLDVMSDRAAHARDRRAHRSRQDRADRGAHRRQHRPAPAGARARHLDRARLRAPCAAVGPRARRRRRPRSRALRPHDGRGSDRHRPLPAGRGRRRRRRCRRRASTSRCSSCSRSAPASSRSRRSTPWATIERRARRPRRWRSCSLAPRMRGRRP